VTKARSNTPDPRQLRSSKRPGRGKRIAQIVIVFFCAVMAVDALVGDRGVLAMWRARQTFDDLSSTLDRLRADNARMSEVARRLRDDPNAIEERARRDLGLIRPGEKVFIVKDLAGSGRTSPQ
jgi:cell division protein FtsB